MTKTIENLFVYLAIYSSLLPLVLFLCYFNKTKQNKPLIVIATYVLVEFLTNFFSLDLKISSVRIVYSGFTIIEYLLFATCFYLFIKGSFAKKAIIFFSILFLLFAVFYFLLIKYNTLDSVPIGVETVLIITYAFYYLYEEINKPSQILIYSQFPFWIVAGIMIYLAGSFFIYIFANQVDSKTFRQYWMFTNVFTTLKNVFFTISILVSIRSPKRFASNVFNLS